MEGFHPPSLGPPSCVIYRVSAKCQMPSERSVNSSGYCLRREQPQRPMGQGRGFREPSPWGVCSQKPEDGQVGKAAGKMNSGPWVPHPEDGLLALGPYRGGGSFPAYVR